MVVAPEQTQRPWLEHIHFVRPIQLDFANVVAQIVRIRDDNLVFGAMFEASRALGEVDATQCTAVRVNGRRHVALHPSLGLSWLRQLDGETIVALCKGRKVN